jgi:Flp pilus assembly protein TadG
MRSKPSEITRGRRGERGAALVMSLLVAMLLLAAGGALIATAGMTAANAVDSTAEVQAYYAADAGLQAALTVMRRNRAAGNGLAANFHTFACGTAGDCVNDGNDLSQWLGPMPVTFDAGTDLRYTLTVKDPSMQDDDTLVSTYVPRYLHVQSIGYGPRGAVKVMEMMLDDFAFDFTTHAAVALHSHTTDSVGMTQFTIGNSEPHTWNGNDQAGLAAAVPAFAVTNRADFDGYNDNPAGLGQGAAMGVAEAVISNDGGNVIGSSHLGRVSQSDLEWWLKDADSARTFLTRMREKAQEPETNRYFTSAPSDMGTDADPKFTFVDGDVTLNGNSDNGAGLLIVTGKYTQGGSSSFHGIVLALGEGNVERNGTPDIAGALVIARFAHVWDAASQSYGGGGDFTSPILTVSGGGNSLVTYNSEHVRKALETLGPRAVGIVEK